MGRLSLKKVENCLGFPAGLQEDGGVCVGLWQREALQVRFEATGEFAVKIFAGGINTVSGDGVGTDGRPVPCPAKEKIMEERRLVAKERARILEQRKEEKRASKKKRWAVERRKIGMDDDPSDDLSDDTESSEYAESVEEKEDDKEDEINDNSDDSEELNYKEKDSRRLQDYFIASCDYPINGIAVAHEKSESSWDISQVIQFTSKTADNTNRITQSDKLSLSARIRTLRFEITPKLQGTDQPGFSIQLRTIVSGNLITVKNLWGMMEIPLFFERVTEAIGGKIWSFRLINQGRCITGCKFAPSGYRSYSLLADSSIQMHADDSDSKGVISDHRIVEVYDPNSPDTVCNISG